MIRIITILSTVLAVSFLAGGGTAIAAPLLDTRVGGLALVGPASYHPASVHYNPAALGLGAHRLLEIYLDGTTSLGHGSILRQPIDPLTGVPTAPSTTARAFEEEPILEAFPHFFLGIRSNLGTESVVFSAASYTPSTQNRSFLRGDLDRWFDPASQGPTRYHGTHLTLYHVYNTIAASYKVADPFIVGVSTSIVYGAASLGFVRDHALQGGTKREADEVVALDDCGPSSGPCRYEGDAAAEAVTVEGTSWGIAFAAGVVVRPFATVDLGLAYVSRVIGIQDGEEVSVKGEAWVRRSRAALENAALDPGLGTIVRDLHGRGTIHYNLPDMLHFGATWQATESLLLNFQLRWINLKLHDQMRIRLTGSAFHEPPATPDRIIIYRGFQDVFALQLGAGYWIGDTLQLQGAVMVESSAVPAEAVTPLAIDSFKADLFISLTWLLAKNWTLRAGYGLIWMPSLEVSAPLFSPDAMVNCVDASYDVDLRQCQQAAEGRGISSNAGEYSLLTHRLGLSLAFHL